MTTEQATQYSTEEFVGRVFDAGLKAIELANVYLGDKLGLYRALGAGGPATAADLAARARVNERHVREWLEQQAVAGVLAVDDPASPAEARRYSLPPEHAEALIEPESPYSIAPLAAASVLLAQKIADVTRALRTGQGVPWDAYGFDGVDVQGDLNRPWLLGQFGTDILPSIADVHERLKGGPSRVLDVACGVGWSSIAVASAYPQARVHGVEASSMSVERARKYAVERGLSDRVMYETLDAKKLPPSGDYDLALIVEAVHDMSDPVGVLSAVLRALAPGASLIVADERVADEFTAPGDEVERFMYAVSVLLCLPVGMNEQPSAATGTVMRAPLLRKYATDAGFTSFEVLDIEHPMLRFYRLR